MFIIYFMSVYIYHLNRFLRNEKINQA